MSGLGAELVGHRGGTPTIRARYLYIVIVGAMGVVTVGGYQPLLFGTSIKRYHLGLLCTI